MIDRVEKQIERMEQEIKAIKASFEKSAAQMPMYSSEITFTTSQNIVKFTHPPIDPRDWATLTSMPRTDVDTYCGKEPIIVTFSCDKGINTFANLEIETISGTSSIFSSSSISQISYNGGARWLVIIQPNTKIGDDGWDIWSPTILRFVVKSAAQGTLGAKMIWQ